MAGLGLRGRGPELRRPVRQARRDLHRAERERDAAAGRQDRLEADRRGGRRTCRAVEPRRRRHPRGRSRQGRAGRLPADAQGDRRRGWPGDPHGGFRQRSRGRLPTHQRRGAPVVRQRHCLPGAPGHRRPPRRGAADRRWPRDRVGPRRPRLLHPAPQPEGHRGVVLTAAQRGAGRRAQGVGRATRPGRGVRRRGHRRVPLPPRRADLRLPRGQHPPAGRALDHRGHHRHGPGQGTDPGGAGWAARG